MKDEEKKQNIGIEVVAGELIKIMRKLEQDSVTLDYFRQKGKEKSYNNVCKIMGKDWKRFLSISKEYDEMLSNGSENEKKNCWKMFINEEDVI